MAKHNKELYHLLKEFFEFSMGIRRIRLIVRKSGRSVRFFFEELEGAQ